MRFRRRQPAEASECALAVQAERDEAGAELADALVDVGAGLRAALEEPEGVAAREGLGLGARHLALRLEIGLAADDGRGDVWSLALQSFSSMLAEVL